MRVHGIMQHDNRDCGVACLATICRFFGIKIPITKLREEMKVDKNGTSLYSINKEAQKYGLEPLVMQGTYNELYNDSKNRKIKLPLIVHIIKNNYEIIDDSIEIQLVDPSLITCKSEMVSEIQIPVRRRLYD